MKQLTGPWLDPFMEYIKTLEMLQSRTSAICLNYRKRPYIWESLTEKRKKFRIYASFKIYTNQPALITNRLTNPPKRGTPSFLIRSIRDLNDLPIRFLRIKTLKDRLDKLIHLRKQSRNQKYNRQLEMYNYAIVKCNGVKQKF